MVPFHWWIEFPEVFDRERGGFDAIIGNPPFAGKNTLINGNREGYLDWLKTLHEESHGNADLVAHFFRRAFNLLRGPQASRAALAPGRIQGTDHVRGLTPSGSPNSVECPSYGGCFGLIATNTIGQGDTRSTGLRWICTHGGTIYAARKRLKWPGQAAVVVSVVNVCRGAMPGPFVLDGGKAPIITAYLFHAGGHDDPATLKANEGKSFQGSIVLGMGFTFDDTDTNGVANSLSRMHELIAKDPRNADRIFPYLGGEEVSTSPTQSAHRFVINFGDLSEEECRRWPDLMAIVEQRVKPQRLADKREVYRRYWWQFAEKRLDLKSAIRGKERVLVVPRVGNAFAFVFLDARQVLNDKLIVFPNSGFAEFAILQSRVHELLTRFQSTTLKDDLQYTPSLCFETFPFPAGVLQHAAGDSPTTGNRQLTALETADTVAEVVRLRTLGQPLDDRVLTNSATELETAGREYYEFRAALMVRNNEGLTKTYNRFHDPHETSPDILQLRELHAAMDRAVLEAYDWHDLAQSATCEFLLDYEDDEEEVSSDQYSVTSSQTRSRTRKKPWRYRWPDTFRDEVLARLLDLNKQRAEQERITGLAAQAAEGKGKQPKKSSTSGKSGKKNGDQQSLPGM